MKLTKELAALLKKFEKGECTPEEKKLLEDWFRQQRESGHPDFQSGDGNQVIRDLRAAGWLGQMKRRPVYFYVVLGLGILLLAAVVFWWTHKGPEQPEPLTDLAKPADIQAPVSCKAVLTLSNGNIIELDSVGREEVIRDTNVIISKIAEGEIRYKLIADSKENKSFNMLFNPKGSRVAKITLSDGTRVWLNNESSLRYPLVFGSRERLVELTGEAYFEVAPDPSKKFVINNMEFTTETTGGDFHINHYHDEVTKWLNLVNGSVKVTVNFGQHPSGWVRTGQQAQVNHGTLLQVVETFNPEKVLAWKNGEFVFDNEDIRIIMHQLSRWYDIYPVYKITDAPRFTGRLSRDQPLSAVLDVLQSSGAIHFRLEGKDVIITPRVEN